MRLSDLRNVIQDHTTIWLQDSETEECLDANEFRYIDTQYDDCVVEVMFPEKYPAISSFGITVIINTNRKD